MGTVSAPMRGVNPPLPSIARLKPDAKVWWGKVMNVWVRVKPLLLKHRKECLVALAFVAVLAGPFILRPADSTAPSRYDRRLVIMTPHPESIRREFGPAFAKHWKRTTGETIFIDWRVAGTTELGMLIKSDFTAAFQQHWQNELQRPWSNEVAASFFNPKTNPTDAARAEFLKSSVGIGVDLFFGGGPYDFAEQAGNGSIVATDSRTGAGLTRIKTKHPAWFSDSGIQATVSGEAFYDPELRWTGTCMSSFGMVFNRDVLKRLGVEHEPAQWSDLTNPKLRGQIALADPGKSGTVAKAFEMLIQQQMHTAVARLTQNPGRLKTPEEIEAAGVREGWLKGLALIQDISANARYFTDQSPKIPLEVTKGDAAAGMCIDYYGRSAEEKVRQPDGTSRVGFVAPMGGTAISVDPMAMMRGAPDPELAEAFMEFVLSDAGQKLWNFRSRVPGGPERIALRRLPIRKDIYTPANLMLMVDANEKPFEMAQAFVYRPERTAHLFAVIRFLIRVICVDTHREQRAAWSTMADFEYPKRAMEVFHDLSLVNYDTATDGLKKLLSARDKVLEVREARRLTEAFRRQYDMAARFAREGE
jgi:ABC-type Fe3+ transport system substrate-binding protein